MILEAAFKLKHPAIYSDTLYTTATLDSRKDHTGSACAWQATAKQALEINKTERQTTSGLPSIWGTVACLKEGMHSRKIAWVMGQFARPGNWSIDTNIDP